MDKLKLPKLPQCPYFQNTHARKCDHRIRTNHGFERDVFRCPYKDKWEKCGFYQRWFIDK